MNSYPNPKDKYLPSLTSLMIVILAFSAPMVFTYEGIGNAVTGHETLRFVGTQGTGGLAGVYVNLTAEGDVGAPHTGCFLSGAGTYTGYVIFAP